MRPFALLFAAVLVVAAAGCSKLPASAAQDRIVLPTTVTPERYDIDFKPDISKLTFTGHVAIVVDVHAQTNTIELNAADLDFTRVGLSGRSEAPKVSYDKTQETATLSFDKPIAPGQYTLSIDYTGLISHNAAGLFAVDYDGVKGRERGLFTQFENSDARRFVPSWDEPNRKAVFALTATVPSDLLATSNMPVAATAPAGPGLTRITFQPSPKMSSYLLYFSVGDFERVTRQVGKTEIGVVFKRGDSAKAQYALDAAAHILPYYNNYFGVDFPLPKLDLIAGPGSSQFFGAMENWGAIFYFERDILIDPERSTDEDRQRVYTVVAHEMAHQWFGDLVTMDWWSDLWLNEGFANWMETKATSQFHPEWNLNLQDIGSNQTAMRADSKTGTHPIIQPIRDVLQANEAFDGAITYDKGAAVVRMLEAYVGSDVWRQGVRNYIAKHAYGNTVTDQLWDEIDAVSPRKIRDIAHDFTLQSGVPLVRVEQQGGDLVLTQDRFGQDEASKAKRRWRVPVTVGSGARAWRGVVSSDAAVHVPLASLGAGPAVVNQGQTGYFRTLYAPALFSRLANAYPSLSSADQLGLFDDASALGLAGYEPIGDMLSLATHMPAGGDPTVLSAEVRQLRGLDSLHDGMASQAAYRAWARARLQPLMARLGWTPRAGEAANLSILRATVIRALGAFDDAAVIAEAQKRFAAYVATPSSLDKSIRDAVLDVVAEHADAKTWEQLHQLALHAKSPLEKNDLFEELGAARDPALAQKALTLVFSNEVDATNGPNIIRAVAQQHPQMAFDFAVANLQRLYVVLEPDSRAEYLPDLAAGGHDEALVGKLDAFAAGHIPQSARSSVVRADGQIRLAESLRSTRVPEIDRWIAANGG
jgi:aminopeptidase N